MRIYIQWDRFLDPIVNIVARSDMSKCPCGFPRLIPLDNQHKSIDLNYLLYTAVSKTEAILSGHLFLSEVQHV